ncbi:hypothetical protein K8O61_16105 [Xanthomonas cerealis pv. cerealis]|uniref:hypothetical protein n=1 Tax=Xanthomonas cerealis TaxID=3390025 RepID=UPI001F1967F6|nr:hypothetical protein [Xanthomonas translucens]UKE68958.1 hypothetical protein K8O61_16105 [Xanthomonas translucens pv. pistacia]
MPRPPRIYAGFIQIPHGFATKIFGDSYTFRADTEGGLMESMDGCLLLLPTTPSTALWRLRLASIDIIGGMRSAYRMACALRSTHDVSVTQMRQSSRRAGLPLRSG